MPLLRRLVREPLVHFALIGVLLFAGIAAAKAARRPVLRVDARELTQLVSLWEAQAQRPPTVAERRAIVDDRIDEELLAREALRLGLDRGDVIIRRRLAQKMAFLSEDTGAADEPTDAALRAFYEKNQARFRTPPRVALRQVYFSGDRPAGDAQRAALRALHALEESEATMVGDPFVLPLTYADISLADLTRDYGPGFAAAVGKAPMGAWTGPVASAYGLHIVRVEARRAAEVAGFEAVREEVREGYLAGRRQAETQAFLDTLRARYRVDVADPAP